mgnify:CR=1 FL=1
MRLPEHVELEGYPGRRELSWETDLTSGSNLLAVPLVARAARTNGELVTTLRWGDREKRFRVRLRVKGPQALKPAPAPSGRA